ncbi:hypothetical protein [Polyangium mundeleinium]|uniref:Uncharacterized protein n=1 Tax=Polyangium mundeleinium TaxID=2995306 RepID=A0ABT5F5L6_9BACT|nr:hypothetical protein [Polyangium mundeleinium]MDC0748391.1 hypothetical protein [Polyangium mundeleinium]
MRSVRDLADVESNCYCIFSGYGNPSYLKRIESALRDICDRPVIDHFFVCSDSEEMRYEDAFDLTRGVLDDAARACSLVEKAPNIGLHVVVQHCCIETWFLGHGRMLRRNPTSPELVEMKRFYDVSNSDPEIMGKPDGYTTKASFHGKYLKEMLLEHGMRYSKEHPGVVVRKDYLDALRQRCASTGHLQSLSALLTTWDALR